MAQPLELGPGWEVGLSEIYYPNNYQVSFNESGSFQLSVEYKAGDIDPAEKGIAFRRFTKAKSKGYYALPVSFPAAKHVNIWNLISHILESIREAALDFEMPPSLRDIAGRIIDFERVAGHESRLRVKAAGERRVMISRVDAGGAKLWNSLGFTSIVPSMGLDRTLPFDADTYVFGLVQQPALYVYCDRVDHQLVGDASAPLLATVPVFPPGEMHAVVRSQYDRPTYVPLSTGYISDIGVSIHHDTGDLVSFESGKVLIKLHFRKARADA